MEIKDVMIAGAGTLGSQIAWQTAFHGFNVTVYDAFDAGLEQGKRFHRQFAELFKAQRGATDAEIEATFARLSYTTDLAQAAANADLVSESVPESHAIKRSFYQALGKAAPAHTVFTTNTSSLLPSSFAEHTGRPERFLALHFANGIWDANIGEVMPHAGTDEAITAVVTQFARDIHMVPIFIKKEHPAYIINSLLIPWIGAGVELLVGDIASPEDIDRTWMISTKMQLGPCAVMDVVGLETVYNIVDGLSQDPKYPQMAAIAAYIKTNFVDRGKLGVKTGEGFYTYPNPRFAEPDFLT